VTRNGQVVGSSLIGQEFTSDKYFHGRPSATVDANGNPLPYNAANSSASNLGPTNPAEILAVEQNADAVRCSEGLPPGPPDIVTPTPSPTPGASPTPTPTGTPTPSPTPCPPASQPQQQIPVDAVTASGSGLDPDISVAYAELQVPRVAKARGLPEQQVEQLVQQHTTDRQFGVLGENGVDVFELNLALDKLGNQ
jgi:potassium-transporting ATPase KdpC subunit